MIELSDNLKMIILGVIMIIVVVLFVKNSYDDDSTSGAIKNEGKLTQNLRVKFEDEQESDKNDLSDDEDSVDSKLAKKFVTRDSSKTGKFAYSSYVDGARGGRSSDLDKFFEGDHPLDDKTGFANSDLTNVQSASYVPGPRRKMKDVDKFNAETLLPREKDTKGWMDDPYESTSVKNNHLINIYRPVGVNTIQTTLKNPSHDIRGTPPNPKLAVSPWQNSSYEPDTNLRNQSLCY